MMLAAPPAANKLLLCKRMLHGQSSVTRRGITANGQHDGKLRIRKSPEAKRILSAPRGFFILSQLFDFGFRQTGIRRDHRSCDAGFLQILCDFQHSLSLAGFLAFAEAGFFAVS